ncbi:multiple epidermal growth factor-like domains protein 6 [Ostrea edulis]|uniref:multiple epidermal growth factor-like domains protein 6 n=1 Tax=Ostrea edulis TaxID=37623 RepID=UPI0024AF2554|nr:multiple epidermal growth factor-like domains protein 6 [Ostrea edulis]
MHTVASVSGEECENEGNNCCAGYVWSITEERCIGCMAGYGGLNCAFQCPYPLYGPGCQRICECDRATCDRTSGCLRTSTKRGQIIYTKEDKGIIASSESVFVMHTVASVSGEECENEGNNCCAGYVWSITEERFIGIR